MSLLRTDEGHVGATSGLGRVGHDNGRLVLYFERRVVVRLVEVWRLLTASPERGHWIPCGHDRGICGGATVQPSIWASRSDPVPQSDEVVGGTREWQAPTLFEWTTDRSTARWELAGIGHRTDIVYIVWIDAVDLQQAAIDGANHHIGFAQFVGLVETGTVPLQQAARYAELTSDYAELFAATLADTD